MKTPWSGAAATLAGLATGYVWAAPLGGTTNGPLSPSSWIEVLDYAGFVLMLLLALGFLFGTGDLVSRVGRDASRSTRHAQR